MHQGVVDMGTHYIQVSRDKYGDHRKSFNSAELTSAPATTNRAGAGLPNTQDGIGRARVLETRSCKTPDETLRMVRISVDATGGGHYTC